MSKYKQTTPSNSDSQRPEWQQNRGERYGNQRHAIADAKVRARRIERAGNNAAVRNIDLDDDDFDDAC